MKLPDYIPTVVITLDRPRTLAPTLAALLRLEETAPDAERSEESNGGKPSSSLRTIGRYVWCFLIDEDRELSISDVNSMIWMGNMDAINEALVQVGALSGGEESSPGKVPETPAVSLSA